MITLLIKIVFAISRMSKKASTVFISVVSFVFLVSLVLLMSGVIYMTNGVGYPQFAVNITIIGAILIFLSIAAVALTTLSSNYVRKNPHKDPKNN